MKEKGVKPMAKRALLAMGLAGIMAAGYPTAVFAGEWRQDSTGYWWQNDDGSYPKAAWQWLDDNRDGVAECYYFGQDGYMAANTEIDGYQVNGDGAWTVDGVVQKMEGAAPVDHALENRKAKEAYKGVLEGEHMDGGYFHLLDINQDGIEEMLFNLSPWTTIYTYQDGQVEEIDTIRNDGYIYDRKNKRILSNYINHGVENYCAHFHDGTRWVCDSAIWYYQQWGDFTESPLSYNDFYQEMQAKRPWSYEGVADKEDVYQTYRDSWQEMDTFNKTYKIWGEVESDDSDTASVENTPANREALLQ